MNNLIKELAKQSGFRYGDGSWVFAEDSDLAEFAQLIVAECVAVINSENYRKHSKGWNNAIVWADGMIKEHFGVE